MKFILSILLTVFSTYRNGVYESVGEVEMQCSQIEANMVLDSIMSDLQNNPEHMFAWAFYGTGEQTDSRKQGFVIHYDTVRYFPEREILAIDLSLISPRGKTNQMHVEPILSDNRMHNGELPKEHSGTGYASNRTIFFGVDNFSNMIKHLDATVTLVPSGSSDPYEVGTQRISVVTHCKFGWFFNLFISRKMYRNTVEWRIEQFLQNLRCTAEHQPLQPINVDLE